MFGHQNDQQNQQQESNQIPDQIVNSPINDINAPQVAQNFTQFQPPNATTDPVTVPSTQPTQVVSDLPVPVGDPLLPAAPLQNDTSDSSSPNDALENTINTNDLLDIKQQALSQLSPLVGHLEQSPEEKFRTTMMMIQASDNQNLLKEAYASAQEIDDEKTRAQALLDVINEINYFTQHHQS